MSGEQPEITMSIYGTKFVESEAILAAQARNWEYLSIVLDGMSAGELHDLTAAADRLASQAAILAQRKDAPE